MTNREALSALKFDPNDIPDIKKVEERLNGLIRDFVIDAKNENSDEARNKIDQWYDAAGVLFFTLKTEKANRVYGTSAKSKNVSTPGLAPEILNERNEGMGENLTKHNIKKFSIEKFLNEQFNKVNVFFEKNIKPILKECRNLDYIIFVWLLLITIAFIFKSC